MEQENKFKYLLTLLVSILIVFGCTTTRYTYKKNKENIPIVINPIYISSRDTLTQLPLLEVINPSLYPILDSIIALNNKCIYTTLGEPTWFFLGQHASDKTVMGITAYQYSHYFVFGSDCQGAFYYKNKLFVSAVKWENKEMIFTITKDTLSLKPYDPNITIFMFKDCKECNEYLQMCDITARYIDNTFTIESSINWCKEYQPIFHTVKKGEVLSKLSSLYSRRNEDVIKENGLTDTVLTKGMILKMW